MVPQGYRRFVSPGGRYSIAYPRGWGEHPSLVNMDLGANGRVVMDALVRPQDGSNVLILSMESRNSRRPSLEDFPKQIGVSMNGRGMEIRSATETTMAGMEAIRVRMSGVERGGRRVETVQVWADMGQRRYMVQLGVYGPDKAKRLRRLLPTFERMLGTFRIAGDEAAGGDSALRGPRPHHQLTRHRAPGAG